MQVIPTQSGDRWRIEVGDKASIVAHLKKA